MVDLKPVQSSNIKAVGHDGADLHVEFANGGHYSYAGVPDELHQRLANSHSPGKFLQAHVIGKFPHTKIDPEADK